jgi:SAM-dependent methyltransferase
MTRKSKKSKKEEIGKGKIFIGIPRERIYLTQFVDNRDAILTELAKAGLGGGYFQAEGHRVDRNRDTICEDFLRREDKPEWLVMIDTDMEHPIDAPMRLVRWNKPIVGALYFHRGTSHDPFAFRYTPNAGLDDYGRPALLWRAMKKEVFAYLDSHNIPMRDGALVVENDPNALMEVDAVATGCIAIHRSVLEAMPKPIFEYRYGGNSEDLVFCKEAKEHGFPIYCDFSTICGHYHWVPMGQAQFRMNYINLGINSTSFSKKDAALWWSNFFGVSLDEAKIALDASNEHETGDYWREKFGDKVVSAEEAEAFYLEEKTGQLYVNELLHWNFGGVYNQIRQRFVSLRERNIIEIGSGIGSLAIQLCVQGCNVLSVEVNPVLRRFQDMRWKDYAKDFSGEIGMLSIVDDTWRQLTPDASFDNAVSTDTFEHLAEVDLKDVLLNIHRVLKVGGSLGFSTNFHQQDIYPQHYDHSGWFSDYLKEIGFMPISEFEYMKVR